MGIYVHVIIFTTYHMYIVDMYARQGISLSCLLDSFVQLCRVRKVLAPPEAVDHACHDFQNTFYTCARNIQGLWLQFLHWFVAPGSCSFDKRWIWPSGSWRTASHTCLLFALCVSDTTSEIVWSWCCWMVNPDEFWTKLVVSPGWCWGRTIMSKLLPLAQCFCVLMVHTCQSTHHSNDTYLWWLNNPYGFYFRDVVRVPLMPKALTQLLGRVSATEFAGPDIRESSLGLL